MVNNQMVIAFIFTFEYNIDCRERRSS